MLREQHSLALMISVAGLVTLSGQVKINEIEADSPGTDTAEYVELYRPDGTGDSLAGLALVFFEGADPSDSVYRVVDLDGKSFDPNGYFLVGGANASPSPDLLFDIFGDDFIKNGSNAVAIYQGTTAAEYLDEIRTTPVANADLVDVIVHRVNTSEDSSLASVFGATDQPDEGENNLSDLETIQRIPDGGTALATKEATTRTTNTPLPRVFVLPRPIQVDEEAGVDASTITLRREGDLSSSVTFNLDFSSFDLSRLTFPSSATFAAGEETTTFTVDTNPNGVQDGDVVFTITASESLSGGPGGPGGPGAEPSYQNGSGSLVIKDNEVPAPTLVINEALVKSDGGSGPEFIEIYNGSSANAVNLTGFKIVFYDSEPGVNFGSVQEEITISSGTLSVGGHFLIGNSAVSSVYGVTPDIVVTDLNLPNGNTTMVLFDNSPQPNPIYSALLQDGEFDAIPNTEGVPLASDILVGQDDEDSPAGYFLTTDGGELSQILELVDGSSIASSATPGAVNSIAPTLYLTRNRELIEEEQDGFIVFKVTRVPDTSGDLTINLQNFDSTELSVPSTLVIPDGQPAATFLGLAQSDSMRDGIQEVTIRATAAGHILDSTTVGVLDSDIPDLGVCDIGFVSAISDDANVFAFVALTELASSTRITFTDNGWRAAGDFRNDEGQITWLAIEDVPAGTVVTFTDNEPDVGTANAGEVNLSDSGDQIFAFQGSLSNPTLLAGIQMNGAWDADATDVFTSALPPALASEGSVAIDPERNNAVYNGPTTVSVSTLKSLLSDANQFTTGNSTSVVGPALIPDLFDFSVGYSVVLGEFSVDESSVTLSFTALGLSDVYRSSNLEDWFLAPGGAEVTSGSFVDSAPLDGKAFYLIQEAGAAAP